MLLAGRDVPGTGTSKDRDELPARPVVALPVVSRQAVRSADAAGDLPRPVDRGRAGAEGRASGDVLRELPNKYPNGEDNGKQRL